MRTTVAVFAAVVACAPYLADWVASDHAAKTTVQLFDPIGQTMASGVVIGEREAEGFCRVLVGTARHVVLNEESGAPAATHLGARTGPEATIVSWAATGDAGAAEFLVKGSCSSNPYRVAPVAGAPAERGSWVFGSGFPVGHVFYYWGKIMAPIAVVAGEVSGQEYITVAYPMAPGNSGGPLFDIFGRVVGVMSGGYPTAPMLAFFATAAQLRAAVSVLPGWEI